MLGLGRFPNESVVIRCCGKIIKVKVLSIKGRKVRLGFEADKDIVIDREEIFAKRIAGSKVEA